MSNYQSSGHVNKSRVSGPRSVKITFYHTEHLLPSKEAIGSQKLQHVTRTVTIIISQLLDQQRFEYLGLTESKVYLQWLVIFSG